jgi:hypothetical protein
VHGVGGHRDLHRPVAPDAVHHPIGRAPVTELHVQPQHPVDTRDPPASVGTLQHGR